MLQYIGARYVPIFYQNSLDPTSSEWEVNVTYEPLTWVSLPNGYMYISKKEVPANIGTPASNPDYWLEAGQYNAYIQSLQDQIDDMNDGNVAGSLQAQINTANSNINSVNNAVTSLTQDVAEIPKHRKFVLIGDSFGVGVQGGGQAWGDGWIYKFAQKFPTDSYYYDPQGDQSFEGAAGFTTTSAVNFIGQLNYVYNNKLGTTNPEEITDIIVLGGTNDGPAAQATIESAIATFCSTAKSLFPNATIKIGVWALAIRTMVYGNSVYTAYKNGCKANGAVLFTDQMLLPCSPTYDSGYGHFNLTGYTLYAPYIIQLILSGHCHYSYDYAYPVTLSTGAAWASGTFDAEVNFHVTEDGMRISIQDSSRKTPLNVEVARITLSDRAPYLYNFASGVKLYFPVSDDIEIGDCDFYYYRNNDPDLHFCAKGKVRIYYDNGYKIQAIAQYPSPAINAYISDTTYSSIAAVPHNGFVIPYKVTDV